MARVCSAYTSTTPTTPTTAAHEARGARGVGAVALRGCGGGLSNDAYRKKADALCASNNAQRLRGAARTTIPINEMALRRFGVLSPAREPHAGIVDLALGAAARDRRFQRKPRAV